jgi:alkylhydroperoxidase family enzyme
LTKAFGRTKATHDERIRQIMERLDRWGNYATFGQVERAEFGWTEADLRYDDGSDEDDE